MFPRKARVCKRVVSCCQAALRCRPFRFTALIPGILPGHAGRSPDLRVVGTRSPSHPFCGQWLIERILGAYSGEGRAGFPPASQNYACVLLKTLSA